ncbi:DinB family protein [Niabella aurantiaca]|uniref:DinB family protein n=1 Tax=Niabella aurantiaca TaxID=379900 RepID=UPI000373BFAE|nr:DinB family protein [Niabella aurantiaca]
MYALDIIDSIRQKAIALINETSPEELNRIPDGFNNNIIWNFGHLVVSGYGLVFKTTQVDPGLVIPLQDKYRKGSRPGEPVTREEVEELIRLSNTFTQTVKVALEADRFHQITEYITDTFGLPVTTIEDMITTVAAHDTLHWQSMRDYARMLKNK